VGVSTISSIQPLDFSNNGGEEAIKEFNEILGKLPHKHKICICGNHDSYHHQKKEETQKLLFNCVYLENESVEIENIKFYGSPMMTGKSKNKILTELSWKNYGISF
jgi:predicted phosphohydrolase